MSTSIDVLGADGSVWELLDPRSGVTLSGGISGLHLPPASAQWSETARIPGRRRRGQTVGGRETQMRVHVGDLFAPRRVGEAWKQLDGAWWHALGGGDAPFTLRVTNDRFDAAGRPDVRTLQLWDATDDPGFAADPEVHGSAEYDVTASAEAAYWSGPDLVSSFDFSAEDSQDYYGGLVGGGFGPPFYISAGSQFSNATVFNPGDVDAYPIYVIRAPFLSAVVGIGEDLVTLPFAQVATQRVVVNTDPKVLSIVDGNGNDLWDLVGGGIDPLFAPVPPRATTALTLALDGADTGAGVDVHITPQYRRAW
jgi:hypothetical protein